VTSLTCPLSDPKFGFDRIHTLVDSRGCGRAIFVEEDVTKTMPLHRDKNLVFSAASTDSGAITQNLMFVISHVCCETLLQQTWLTIKLMIQTMPSYASRKHSQPITSHSFELASTF